jgi:hypothetical protein
VFFEESKVLGLVVFVVVVVSDFDEAVIVMMTGFVLV